MNRIHIVALLCALFLLPASPSEATIVVRMSQADLARQADVIIHGVVTKKRAELQKNRRKIYTVYTLQPSSFLKTKQKLSTSPRSIDVYVLGGIVGKLGMRVAGTARMKTGEEVVLFLEQVRGRLMVLGMTQGKFSVQLEKKTRKRVVSSSRAGLTFATRGPNGRLKLSPPTTAKNKPLDAFLSEIRAHLKSKR